MSLSYPMIPLGRVLTRRKDQVLVQDGATYARVTIRMNGKGVVVRDTVPGSAIATKLQFRVGAGQLVLSKIDARNGAFGILPPACDGAIITGNFWAFEIAQESLAPGYLDYLSKTPMFVEFCVRASEGTTNRLYLQEPRFLAQRIPLPSLAEQRRIVGRLDELAAKIERARVLRRQAMEEARALSRSIANALLRELSANDSATSTLGDVADIRAGVTLGRDLSGPLLSLPYLRVANVQDGYVDLREVKQVNVLPGEGDKWRLEPGDILMTEGGDWDKLGRAAVWRGEIPNCIHQNHIFRVRVDQAAFDPEFLAALIGSESGRAYFQQASKQTTNLASINQRQLKAFPVVRPPLSEQRRTTELIREAVSMGDGLRLQQRATAVELDAMLPAVLERAFKGKL